MRDEKNGRLNTGWGGGGARVWMQEEKESVRERSGAYSSYMSGGKTEQSKGKKWILAIQRIQQKKRAGTTRPEG